MRSPRLLLVASLVLLGCSDTDTHAESVDAAPDARDPFGNGEDHDAATGLELIEDGGAARLSDGAVIYLELWARPCPPGAARGYDDFGREFFATYCLHCHSEARIGKQRSGAPNGLNFDTFEQIRTRAEGIFEVAADGNVTMPQSDPRPTPEERTALGDFLACSAR